MTHQESAVSDFADPATLAHWLAARHIDTRTWGQPGKKSLQNLWVELQRGESQLLDHPPRRMVRVAELWIRRGGLLLLEAAQTFADGSVRTVKRPPAEKILPAETPHQAALRCLSEELGVPPGSAVIASDAVEQQDVDANSLSYPGLRSLYAIFRVSVAVDSLPDGPFTTAEATQQPGDPVTHHHWEWVLAHNYASPYT
jgi:8-oxo-dGTP pyrophosphatase MutT (NUDIX family)